MPDQALLWSISYQSDPIALKIADRHYSRQSPGSKRFMPPGRQLVLLSTLGDAVFGVSWPFSKYVNRARPTAYLCTIFRNEGPTLSSTLIREALGWTRWKWPEMPEDGMITLINAAKVRHKRDPGRCFLKAGFVPDGHTKNGLILLRCAPSDFPDPIEPIGEQITMPIS